MSDWIWLAAMFLMGVLGLIIGITLPPVEDWPPLAKAFWQGFVPGFSFGAIKSPKDDDDH